MAADRQIIIAAGNDILFKKLFHALGLTDEPRYHSNADRTTHADELKVSIEGVLRTQPAAHWIEVLEAAGVPCALVQTVADAVEMEQVRARNMIVTAGGLRMVGNPIKMSDLDDPTTRRPAPDLDADGDRIRREFGGG